MPLDYIFINSCLLGVGFNARSSGVGSAAKSSSEKSLEDLEILVWVNFFLMMIIGACWVAYQYHKLFAQMKRDPMEVHRQGIRAPLDNNEVSMLFRAVDKDGNGLLDLKELVSDVVDKTSGGVLKPYAATLVPDMLTKLSSKPIFRDKVCSPPPAPPARKVSTPRS